MNRSNKWMVFNLSWFILLHLSIWLFGYLNNRLFAATSFLNMLSALSLIAYWAVRQLRIQQHYIEVREMTVLGIEVIIFGTAIYAVASGITYTWITIMQYISFGIHLLLLVMAMIFMFTVKINKLM